MGMSRGLVAVVLACSVSAGPLSAQAVDSATAADSARSQRHVPPFFTYRDALLFGGFIAAGIALAPADKSLARTLQDSSFQESGFMKNGAAFFRFMGQPAPQIIGVGLYGVGRFVVHSRRMAALGLHGLESMLMATAVTDVGKISLGRARPYVHVDTVPFSFGFLRGFKGRDFQSFPSGHATTAFAAAAAVTAETSHWADESDWWPGWKIVIGTTMFGGATLVGVSRMFHNDHWATDVAAGAAIGTFSGIKTVRYVYRHPQNKVDRVLLATTLAPLPGGGMYVGWTVKTGGGAAPSAAMRPASIGEQRPRVVEPLQSEVEPFPTASARVPRTVGSTHPPPR
ncbi:MAG TPA: phosphatase PAP2 family protein [Longimicrobiales bacterium]|nr:phosphatase PAP2 family protein [Longimicrobiales bacterium]